MRNWLKKKILGSGTPRMAASVRGPSAAFLMYHSVLPDPALRVDSLGKIIHSELAFRAQMELLAGDFHPITLDKALKHIRGSNHFPKRSVVVTFDDGYADNYEVAIPVLEHVGVPATFYVAVDCIENRRLPWPSRLRFAFRNTKLNMWTDPRSKAWTVKHPAGREEAFLASCDLCCQLSGVAQETLVRRVEQELEASAPPGLGSLMMSYDQLQTLSRHGHTVGSHTVGSHTMTHPNMAYVKEADAQHEFKESKRQLELRLDAPIRHFSYPCPALSPHWSAQTVEQSRSAGYETAVTTDSGLTGDGDNPLCLKRIAPTKTMEGLRWNLESAFAGRAV